MQMKFSILACVAPVHGSCLESMFGFKSLLAMDCAQISQVVQVSKSVSLTKFCGY